MSITNDPTEFNTPNRDTLSNLDVGSLGLAVLTLTRELWVLTDRLHVIEAVLAERNIDIREDVQSFQPDKKMTAALRQQSAELTERILSALSKE